MDFDRTKCISGPRPCPETGCDHHLWPDTEPRGRYGSTIKIVRRSESCSKDVAERGPASLVQIGRIFGISRERVRQIESRALVKLQIAERVRSEIEDLAILYQSSVVFCAIRPRKTSRIHVSATVRDPYVAQVIAGSIAKIEIDQFRISVTTKRAQIFVTLQIPYVTAQVSRNGVARPY